MSNSDSSQENVTMNSTSKLHPYCLHVKLIMTVIKHVQKVFIQCEKIFRAQTHIFKTSVVCKAIVTEMLQDIHIISCFKTICLWAYGVVVSMFDFHRSDRGSNPGRGGKIS